MTEQFDSELMGKRVNPQFYEKYAKIVQKYCFHDFMFADSNIKISMYVKCHKYISHFVMRDRWEREINRLL